jgi:succinoglycan biosynthesis transport protein ExoP
MLDRLSIPRRPLDFGDYIDMLRRNLAWLIAPVFIGLVLSTVVAFMLENTFQSVAILQIVPQQISPELIQNISAQDATDRINGMAQSIESRNTLTAIINNYGLYKSELKSEPLQDVIERMKNAIEIRPLLGVTGVSNIPGKNLPAMEVGFSYRDKYIAQRVCQDLISRFMNAGTEQSLGTLEAANNFLNDQTEQAKRTLDQIERKLAEYRSKNAGRLPEELQTNLSQMNVLESRASTLSEATTRNAAQRMMLDSELRIARDRLTSLKPGNVVQNQKVAELDKEIDQLQNTIASMRDQFTDDYPDVQAARDRLASLKKQRDEAAKEKPEKTDASAEPPDNPMLNKERLDAQGAVEQIQAQIKANTLEAATIKQQMSAVNGALGSYENRISGGRTGDKDYGDLLQDREIAEKQYYDFEAKRQKTATALDLERRKQGETLELLDSASLPSEPKSPKRTIIIPLGAVGGLVIGLILVGFREVKDTSLKNLKDARLYTQLPILGSIPLLENDVVVQRRKQVMWVSWATGAVLGLAIVGASIAHYYLNGA